MKNKTIAVILILLAASAGLTIDVASAASLDGVDVHGFISQGFLYSDEYNYFSPNSTDGTFEYNEMGINFSKNLTDKLRMGLQIFSRDLGDVANNKVTLDWAYGDYRWQDWLGIRAGRIKIPRGLYNEVRDVDLLRTSIIMPVVIYNDLVRDTAIAINGVGLYGNLSLSAAGSLDYQLVAGPMNIDNDSGTGKYFEDSLGGQATQTARIKSDTSYIGNLRWNTPLDGLILSGTYESYKNHAPVLFGGSIPATIDIDTNSFLLGMEYTWQDLVVAAEYKSGKQESLALGNTTEKTEEGYYVSASYRFNELFSLGACYSVWYPDVDDRDGTEKEAIGGYKSDAWLRDLSLSLRFDMTDYCLFKLEGHAVDGTANVLSIDNNPDRSEDSWYYGAAKVTFSF